MHRILLVVLGLVGCSGDDAAVGHATTAPVDTDSVEDLDPCLRSMWGGSIVFEGPSDEVRVQMRTFCEVFGGVNASQALTVRQTDLTDLDDLSCVCELGDLNIIDNPQLQRVELPGLTKAGRLTFDRNLALTEVRLPRLATAGPVFIADAQIALLDLGPVKSTSLHIARGLIDPVEDVPRRPAGFEWITVQACADLSTLAGLPCQDGGVLQVGLNPKLRRPSLPPCTTRLDSLQITDALSDLSPLREVSVARRLTLSLDADLQTLDGLQSVESGLASLSLFGGPGVKDGRGLGHLRHVGALHMDDLGTAEGLFVLDRIPIDGVRLGGLGRTRAPWLDPQIIMAQVNLNNLPWTDLSALRGVERVRSLRLSRMPIVDLDDLVDLERVDRDLVLEGLPELADVSVLHGIIVGGELRVSDCPKLSQSAVDALERSLVGG